MPGKVKKHQSTAAPKAFSLISDARLRQLYAAMLRCRILEERARLLHRQEKWPGRYPYGLGREAAVIGAAIDLRRTDWISPSPQDPLTCYVKGFPLKTIVAQLRSGNADLITSPASPSTKSERARLNIIPSAATTAAQFSIAVGVAFSIQARQNGGVVMAFASEALSIDQWRETLRFASTHTLPLLFIVHGDLPASRKKTRPANLGLETTIAGTPVIPVDANDVVAMYRVAYESIHKARHGGGPTLIQAITPEATAPASSRTTGPIERMEAYLAAKGLFSAGSKQQVIDRFNQDLEAAMRAPQTV